jgi:hypothetical protein
MPCGSTGKAFSLEKDDIGHTKLCEMIGHTAADNSTADNDNLGTSRERG